MRAIVLSQARPSNIAAPVRSALRSNAAPAVISALLALVLYAVTLGGTYVYDDLYIVQRDPRITDVKLWPKFWTKDYFNGGADNLYRPLVSMTYALQAKLIGNDDRHAWTYHLFNWLLHAAVCAAVAELARRITNDANVALLAGILFAAHPVHVEAVANIVGRAELMCALGTIGALILFIPPLTIARSFAIWGCFLLALLSKEQGMLVPLLLLAAVPLRRHVPVAASAEALPEQPSIDYFNPSRHQRDRAPAMTLILLLLWTLAAYILFRERILKFWWDRSFLDYTINPLVRTHGLLDGTLMPYVLLGRYVALLVAPIHLSIDWGGNLIGSRVRFNDPYLYIGLIVGNAWAIACVVAIAKKRWTVAFCLFAAAALLGMVLNAFTIIGTIFAERLLYIPSAFLLIVAAIALSKLRPRALVPVMVVIVTLMSLRTVSYASEWNDRLRLYAYETAIFPQSNRLQILLGEELDRRGHSEEGLAALSIARDLDPDYYRAWMLSAIVAEHAGRLAEALELARHAHRLQPSQGSATLIANLNRRLAATRKTVTSTTRAILP